MESGAAAASSEAGRPGEEGGVGEAEGHVAGSCTGETLLSRLWVEPVDSVLYLVVFGLLGTLLRCGLVRLFSCYSTAVPSVSCRSLDDGVLFVTLAPNMLGCLFIGLLSTPAAAGGALTGTTTLAALPASHRWQRCVCGPRVPSPLTRALA